MKIYEKTDPELSESHRTRMAKYVAAHKEVGTRFDHCASEKSSSPWRSECHLELG